MAKNTSITIEEHFEGFIASQIQSGRYGSASEVIRSALRLLENQDIGKTCDGIRIGYRKFLQGSHVIFYQQIGSQQIRTIRILHQSMDVNPILGA